MKLEKAKKALIIILVLVLVIFINTRCSNYSITHKYIENIRPELRPGDIIIERTDWRISNPLYPGFWKHSFIYTGTLTEMDEYFNGSKVINGSVSEYLREKMPEVYEAYTEKYGEYEANMIESKHLHVRIGPIEDYAQSDYLGVLRPKLSNDVKLRAILKALSFAGKFYDLLFDYSDNSTLACSEIVYHSYREDNNPGGLNFRLAKILWVNALLPNDIAKCLALENDSGQCRLEFIAFLDPDTGLENTTNRSAFSESWKRPSFTIVDGTALK